ncbi:hypothetical protein DID88_004759 [Monilinia fructigena]|uniref:Uncharacterized protein n=1 Tax=Monilinia fructigena TaxID=38457 RepID=A0A395ITE3_9HELO|nr:hypothetical protein DID88_004759 [Monilinia fructigena]
MRRCGVDGKANLKITTINTKTKTLPVIGHEVLAGWCWFRRHEVESQSPMLFAKELIAGFAAGEVDKLAETKGEDWVREHRLRERSPRSKLSISTTNTTVKMTNMTQANVVHQSTSTSTTTTIKFSTKLAWNQSLYQN